MTLSLTLFSPSGVLSSPAPLRRASRHLARRDGLMGWGHGPAE
jgi:hypothetical protein